MGFYIYVSNNKWLFPYSKPAFSNLLPVYYSVYRHHISEKHTILFPEFAEMRFRPNRSELSHAHRHGSAALDSDLMDQNLYVSGSNWSRAHLEALKVVSFDGLEPRRLMPSRHIPGNSSISKLRSLIRQIMVQTPNKYLQISSNSPMHSQNLPASNCGYGQTISAVTFRTTYSTQYLNI